MSNLGRILIVTGLILVAAGLIITFSSRLPWLGKLPGDFTIKRDNFSFYFPLSTCILISLILSLVSWLFRR